MMPALLLLVLFGGALAIAVARRDAAARWLAPAAVLAGLAAAIRVAALQPVVEWPWWGPHLHPQLAVVGISRVLVVLVPLIAFPVVLYAGSPASKGPGRSRLLALLVAFTGAMELVAMAGDFLTLLIGWELVGACSWAL
ncbi:MAG: NADH-quinone oxidoreductase subunit L, partial [Acidobacteriota bacterium]